MKIIFLIISMVLIASCGSIVVSPHQCKSKGVWTSDEQYYEQSLSEDYFLGVADVEVKIKDIFARNNIKCEQLKTIRVKIHTAFFIKRTIEIFYTLN